MSLFHHQLDTVANIALGYNGLIHEIDEVGVVNFRFHSAIAALQFREIQPSAVHLTEPIVHPDEAVILRVNIAYWLALQEAEIQRAAELDDYMTSYSESEAY